MKNSYLIISLKLATSLFPSSSESYILEIPKYLNLQENGYFNIGIIENNLNENENIKIDFADEFILHDIHGNKDIVGSINNNQIIIETNDTGEKTINYSLSDNLKGEYNGFLDFSIKFNKQYPSNMLANGSYINSILQEIQPNIITFSHDQINDYDQAYDISMNQDESIMLYDVLGDAIISNNTNEKILANEDMSGIFKDITFISRIYNIDFIDFSNCKDISYMFYNNNNLEVITGLNNIDTSKCENMSNLFVSVKDMSTIDLSNFDLSNTKDISCMFKNANFQSIVGLDSWNTENVIDMSHTFEGCMKLNELPVSNWDVSNVQTLQDCFRMCQNISTLSLDNWNISNVTNLSGLFFYCQKLTSIGDISSWDTSNVTDMSYLFKDCTSLKKVTLTNFKTSNVTDMSHMFDVTALTSVGDLTNWDVSNVENFSDFMRSCVSLNNFADISKWHVSSKCKNLSHMFENNFYNSRKTNFSFTLAKLDLTGWDVSGVTDISGMFLNSMNMTVIDCTGWDVSNVTDMSSAFGQTNSKTTCKTTTLIGFDKWDVSNVTNMNNMFYRCNMSDSNSFINWNTSKLKTLDGAFYGCGTLDMRQFDNWNVSNVESYLDCFGGNTGFYIIDPSTGGYSVKQAPAWYV